MEKLSSRKLVPGAKKVGDRCYKVFSQVYFDGKAGELKEYIFQGVQQDRKGTWKTKECKDLV